MFGANRVEVARAGSLRVPSKKTRAHLVCALAFFGGDDGSRTRVQKPVGITFSVGSPSIEASLS